MSVRSFLPVFPRLSLSNRVFVYFAILIVVSLGVLSFYSYRATYSIAEKQVTQLIRHEMGDTAATVEARLSSVELQAQLFAVSRDVQNAMLPTANGDLVEDYEDFLALLETASAYEASEHVSNVRIYLNTNRRFFWDRDTVFPDYRPLADANVPVSPALRDPVWVGDLAVVRRDGTTAQVLSCVQPIRQLDNLSVEMGMVVMDTPLRDVVTELGGLKGFPDSSLSLIDRSGTVMVSSDPALWGVQRYRIGERDGGPVDVRDRAAQDVLLMSRSILDARLSIVAEFALSQVAAASFEIVRGQLVIVIVVLVAAFLVAYVIAGTVTHRVHLLALHMNRIETTGFEERIPLEYDDEITELTRSFNRMARRVRTLISDVYEAQLREKESQIELLHARINPHFLYNTLDAVNAMATGRGANEIADIVKQISDFFRLSLNNGSELTTIARELKLVKAYVSIQRARFEHPFNLTIDLDPGMYALPVVVMAIQPLVENSISHGILPSLSDGSITVRGSYSDGEVELVVEDDGAGMDEGTLRKVQRRLARGEPGPERGYGLVNVDQRIKHIYGESYGISFESSEGVGTRTTLTYPCVNND